MLTIFFANANAVDSEKTRRLDQKTTVLNRQRCPLALAQKRRPVKVGTGIRKNRPTYRCTGVGPILR